MWYYIIILIILFFSLCGCIGLTSNLKNNRSKTNTIFITDKSSKMNKKDIQNKLIALKKSNKPAKLNEGAMCYKIAVPPDRAEYVCPECGEKTLYSTNSVPVILHLDEARFYIKNINNIDIILDEKEFCKKCSPDIDKPVLNLIINYSDGTIYKVNNISITDAKLIMEFLKGEKVHRSSTDQETPLRDYLDRLMILFGINIDI